MNIVACTGHRHIRFNENLVLDVCKKTLELIKCDFLLCGGAIGGDSFWGLAALKSGIPYNLIIPYKEAYAKFWPQKDKDIYEELTKGAQEIIYTGEEYSKFCFFARDRYLVDNSSSLVALYDGRKTGGTYYTCKYAEKVKEEKKPNYKIISIWSVLEKLSFAKEK